MQIGGLGSRSRNFTDQTRLTKYVYIHLLNYYPKSLRAMVAFPEHYVPDLHPSYHHCGEAVDRQIPLNMPSSK